MDFTDGKGLFPLIKSCLLKKGIEIEEKYYIFLWCVGVQYRYASQYDSFKGGFKYTANCSVNAMLNDEEVHKVCRHYKMDKFRRDIYKMRFPYNTKHQEMFSKVDYINLKWFLHKKDTHYVEMPTIKIKCSFCSCLLDNYNEQYWHEVKCVHRPKDKEAGKCRNKAIERVFPTDYNDSKYWK